MEWKQLQEFLFSRAVEHASPRLLFRFSSRAPFLSELKADPGPSGTETFRAEVGKLQWVRALRLPGTLFEGWSERMGASGVTARRGVIPRIWRSRAGRYG